MDRQAQPIPGISIVLPVYNEETVVGEVVDSVQTCMQDSGIPFEIIAVDDGSNDTTLSILNTKDVVLLRHTTNKGYGAALKSGIRASRYPYVAILDADGTYAAEDILTLIPYVPEYDMVVGARIGRDAYIPWLRRPAKWLLTAFANFLTDTHILDLNSGLRIFKKDVVRKFFNFLPSQFSFTTTITIALLTNGYLIKYVPTRYIKRKGSSKIRPIRDTINFFALILRTVLYFRPTRIFIPLCVVVTGIGCVKMMVDLWSFKELTSSTLLLMLAGLQIGVIGLLADLIHKRTASLYKEDDRI